MKENIYLDHNANTPVDPRVSCAIAQHLTQSLGNPSSLHAFGRFSKGILIKSRDFLAQFLGVHADTIVFTSGGTEGANLFIRGICEHAGTGHIITSSVEHPCVLSPIRALQEKGFEVTYLNPGPWGAIKPEIIEEALQPDTKLIAIMAVNNETGVKTDIEKIAQIAKNKKIPFFVDAVALLGKEQLVIPEGVSAMCFSGQKIHATSGIGFCFINQEVSLSPFIVGGQQEHGRRGGTENLPGIVGLTEAVAIIKEELPFHSRYMKKQRDHFEKSLLSRLPGVLVNGEGPRIVNTSNLYFPGTDGSTLLAMLDMEGLAVSHGSACTAGAMEPSHVLLNMGFSKERANGSIRFSFGRTTTEDEVNKAIAIVETVVKRLRAGRSATSI